MAAIRNIFDEVPNEVLNKIIQPLPNASVFALASTSKTLHARLPSPHPLDYTMLDLLEIEQWPLYDTSSRLHFTFEHVCSTESSCNYLACSRCLLIRSESHFRPGMQRGPYEKYPQVNNGDDQRRFRTCRLCERKLSGYALPSGPAHHKPR